MKSHKEGKMRSHIRAVHREGGFDMKTWKQNGRRTYSGPIKIARFFLRRLKTLELMKQCSRKFKDTNNERSFAC